MKNIEERFPSSTFARTNESASRPFARNALRVCSAKTSMVSYLTPSYHGRRLLPTAYPCDVLMYRDAPLAKKQQYSFELKTEPLLSQCHLDLVSPRHHRRPHRRLSQSSRHSHRCPSSLPHLSHPPQPTGCSRGMQTCDMRFNERDCRKFY